MIVEQVLQVPAWVVCTGVVWSVTQGRRQDQIGEVVTGQGDGGQWRAVLTEITLTLTVTTSHSHSQSNKTWWSLKYEAIKHWRGGYFLRSLIVKREIIFTKNIPSHFSGQTPLYKMKLSLNMSGKYLLSNFKSSQILILKSLSSV